MSGTASVPNTFANAVTATGQQLDTNYVSLVNYLNDPTNRNNYSNDTGTTNTIVCTFSPAVVGGYTAGLELTFKVGNTNSGQVQLNANGLGNKNVLNFDQTGMSPGQLAAGSIGKVVYDGTSFISINTVRFASQLQMEAAVTSTLSLVAVPITRFQYHPLSPKAWAVLDGTATGTISTSVGVQVLTHARLGTGTYGIAFTAPFSSAAYMALATTSDLDKVASIAGRGTATCTIVVASGALGTASDTTNLHFVAFGDLP